MADWFVTKDGDLSCLQLYERHYSCYDYKDGRKRSQFVGPGEHIVLRTGDADAMFVWRKFIDDSGQQGVNCAVFRNESEHRSSDLIRQADAVADFCWPGERHYTYVNSKAVRSSNPGFCFVAAGWRRCGMTKSGLRILEKLPVGTVSDEIMMLADRLDHWAPLVASGYEVPAAAQVMFDAARAIRAMIATAAPYSAHSPQDRSSA